MLAPGGPAPVPAAVRRGPAHPVAAARQHGDGRPRRRRCTPASTRSCAQAMPSESRLFFAEILQQNRSALELVRAPFTFVNERLAAHYGVAGVTGAAHAPGGHHRDRARRACWARPAFSPSPRRRRTRRSCCAPAGCCRTCCARRWAIRPPAAQEMVPAPDPALGLTRRQSLERRTAMLPVQRPATTSSTRSASAWRSSTPSAPSARSDRGQPIDASGALPSGQKFQDTERAAGAAADRSRAFRSA